MTTDPSPTGERNLPRGIGNPARQALAHLGIVRLDQVAERSEAELLAVHGVGPRAITVLREALADAGLGFASG